MTTIIDTAAGFPSPQAIKDAGHVGIMAYVSPSRPGTNFPGKPITREIADNYRAHGIDVAAIFEYGKPGGSAPSDWTTGREGGRRMAAQALQIARDAGMPGYCPVLFAVDEDITIDQWNSTAVEFFRGCGDAIGTEWVGIYGSSRVCSWAIEDKVIGGSHMPGSGPWAWVTRAWSDDDGRGYAALYQRVVDTPSNPGPKVGGITVDVNDVYARDWGQWSIDRAPANTSTPVEAPVVTRPAFNEIQAMGNSCQSRNGQKPRYIFVHTQEGGGNAQSLAAYLNNPANDASYHYTVDNGGTVVDVVDTDLASWSVGDANSYSINLCFAGSYASWSRDQWLNNMGRAIDIAAYLVVQDCHKYGIPVHWLGSGGRYAPANAGVSDHQYVTDIIGWGTHTDCGPGFPGDVFAAALNKYATNAPVVNLIDQAADVAKSWIGARITRGEVVCPGNTGRFAEFEHAHVYWKSGANKAFPIPHADPNIPGSGLFEAFAEYGWEAGKLGFPVMDFAKVDGGAVQAFEGGVLLRKDGTDHGFYVHGDIGAAFAAQGWEQGPLGWPTSNEEPADDLYGKGSIKQSFEHADLVFSPNNVITVKAV